MAKKEPKDEQSKDEKRDERQSRFYNDYDSYNWAGQKIDNGAEMRRKGSDR